MSRFPGIYVATVTPFTVSYEVDFKRLKEHVDWLIQEGVDGIIPTGSLGEYATLTSEERAQVITATIDAAAGRVPVVIGGAAPSTKQVVELIQLSKEKGAEGVMALPPINYKPTEDEVVAHYEAVSNAGLPVIVYNNPYDYPVDLTPRILQKLSKFENIVAAKEFSGDVRRVYDILRETDLEVMIGVDDLALEGALAGATGWIAGFANAFPRESIKVFNMTRTGSVDEALELYRYLLPLFHFDANPRLVQAIKYVMDLVGQPAGPSRPPRLPLPEEDRLAVQEAYKYAVNRPIRIVQE
ncbi:dihydrodipicolinate synthase family protein [Paenibacillus donghaensis]|uniref:dihydrodipicolinate synthase family protein n=1 Tax=Paenibacillus donghaensis TaxID=414771 RepID=UPI001883670F|nr:dihydrodipicolinate synthase family protein [Paenibacillus donghaensis]MBE9917029.1 dihydrodipicolinate synthase family protein [Paenibacillus donghaensis]